MGSLCSKQNARLHSEHPADDARISSFGGFSVCVDSGIIVLLLKHVHLQKEGGAVRDQQVYRTRSLS